MLLAKHLYNERFILVGNIFLSFYCRNFTSHIHGIQSKNFDHCNYNDAVNTIIDGSLCHGYYYRIQVINFGQEAKGVD